MRGASLHDRRDHCLPGYRGGTGDRRVGLSKPNSEEDSVEVLTELDGTRPVETPERR